MKCKMSTTFSSKVIREWLHEYKSLPEAEMHTYASTIRANDELIVSLYQLFEDDDIPQETADPVCHQLFNFYRSGRPELQRFTLEFAPLLIFTYLTGVANNDKKKSGGIEACLLGIYNLEITDGDGNGKISRFTIPSIACPSIYHEPPSLATLALTESALLCYHSDEHVTINVGPLPQFENINAQNRLPVMTHVMSRYNRDVVNLSPRSHQMLCRMCSRLSKMGFEQDACGDTSDSETSVDLNESSSSTSSRSSQRRGVRFVTERRVPLSSQFLVEVLTSIYFVMFNGHARLGRDAVEAVDERAGYELWADVLMVTNAIKNSLMYNPSGQPMDGPMGISIALSPTTSNPSFSKHAITNASFRAKKLPDDIEVPDSPENETAPPAYEEVLEQDRGKSDIDKVKAGSVFAKPLKSIMKSSKDKMKMGRKESESRRKDSTRDLMPDSHSPRQGASSSQQQMATSQSLILSQSMNGADMLDLESISVSVVRSTSRTKVDQIELRSVSGGLGHENQHASLSLEPDVIPGHHRTSSFPEGGFVNAGSPIMNHEYGSSPTTTEPLLGGGSTSSQTNINGLHDSDDECVGFTTAL